MFAPDLIFPDCAELLYNVKSVQWMKNKPAKTHKKNNNSASFLLVCGAA